MDHALNPSIVEQATILGDHAYTVRNITPQFPNKAEFEREKRAAEIGLYETFLKYINRESRKPP